MELYLTDNVKDSSGNKIVKLSTSLNGDGTTPLVQSVGESIVIGFHDDGSPIFKENKLNDQKIESAQQKFMATALKLQKMLTKINGNDSSNINLIH